MTTLTIVKPAPEAPTAPSLDKIWFTRCPVPTATGLAYKLGWLADEFAGEKLPVETLQDLAGSELRRHHYDHQLPALIREGGNLLAIGARAQGAPTRLVGLTWIDEYQAIIVRPDSGIHSPADLKGRRLALPTWSDHPIPSHQRGSSISRGMSLHGYKGALAAAGLTLDDVQLVEVDTGRSNRPSGDDAGRSGGLSRLWSLDALADGDIDAVYVKGASAVDAAGELGLEVGINLDKLPDRRFRVNNGTPRPITVHESLIEDHFDILVRFLYQTLRAAEWARTNLAGVRAVLEAETRGSAAAVSEAYGDEALRNLHPTLDDERLALFEQQKKFTWVHGFSERDFSLDEWVDERPLAAARKLLAERI
ncbi:ABC transporter substrate-binding protein [Phenylobacterium sp.]|jgi:ABC-type nitrate/sulfonate/bicarbonate transport system substrate-binding protein|uniref:ABC transporter substrate-binding protein n=1 Tax=Phenylobacterium sp. TaxID=1871053 RepID=UPI00378432F1